VNELLLGWVTFLGVQTLVMAGDSGLQLGYPEQKEHKLPKSTPTSRTG